MYDIKNLKDRKSLLKEVGADNYDNCQVDAVCDAIPSIIQYIEYLEEMVKTVGHNNQKLNADLVDAQRRINNLNSQKARRLKKQGK
jgi:hypothetical protein